jgi:hypothetical protein
LTEPIDKEIDILCPNRYPLIGRSALDALNQ